ncbi:MAG: hypothetical protein HYZ08_01490 [Candidatus Kerfeldbacteria bacterium]|nr:hypothetical protein [Candidatus Kerfeldbacteria bacterium]
MRFTSHTIHRIPRFLVASVVMTMLLAWGFPVDARSTVDTKFYFTKSVMQRYGKTLTSSEGDFRVGIRPGIFDDPAWVKIKLADPELAQLPENFLLVSSHIYEYGVSVPEPDETTKSIWLSMDFDSKTKNRRRPYVWDRGKQTWHELPGKRVEGESTYQFELRFPWATVAILEDTSRLEGPEKIDASRLPATGFQAYSILDVESGRVLEHMNGTRIKHPASLTKIMTAMVMLDQDLRMSSVLTYAASDNAEGGKLLV